MSSEKIFLEAIFDIPPESGTRICRCQRIRAKLVRGKLVVQCVRRVADREAQGNEVCRAVADSERSAVLLFGYGGDDADTAMEVIRAIRAGKSLTAAQQSAARQLKLTEYLSAVEKR